MHSTGKNNQVLFSTKGRTLSSVIGNLNSGDILPLRLVSYHQFLKLTEAGFSELFNDFKAPLLIVRSSCSKEDGIEESNAGKFLSLPNVKSPEQLQQAMQQVFCSYGELIDHSEEVLIQPQLENVKHCGVMFTKDTARSEHYFIITDDVTGGTDTVTSGSSNNVSTYVVMKNSDYSNPFFKQVLTMAEELCLLFSSDSIDIEYAIDSDNKLWLFQVRPLINANTSDICSREHLLYSQMIKDKVEQVTGKHPYLHGSKSVLGVMPDWNPAEIIGLYPKPLALSLYKNLVTDSIWAYQRDNYGYQNLRGFPLLVDFFGLPYIDVRVSFNSFLPRDLNKSLSAKLVDFYIDSLVDNPSQHDSVEFDIVLSCYTPDINNKLSLLKAQGFTDSECSILSDQLRILTNRIIDPRTGLWIQDLHRIERLKARHQIVIDEFKDPISRIYWLLEDCKRYGTLPFAGLARAAFIAVQLLRSLKTELIFTDQEYHQYLSSLNTVSGQMTLDYSRLSLQEFLSEYGHLRPGTYDICSPRYDVKPDQYFNKNNNDSDHSSNHFQLSASQYARLHSLLKKHGINHSADSLLHFIKSAIEGREYAKFIFTRSLSDALESIAHLGAEHGFSRDDLAFVSIDVIYELMSSSADIKQALTRSIEAGKEKYKIGSSIKLPPLMTSSADVFSYKIPSTTPHYITVKKVLTATVTCDVKNKLSGKIVFISSADPGFDWIFSHNISGFVTAFGGGNSHMAIRASELGIPAVIGVGEEVFEQWRSANTLELDCENQKVRIIN